MRLCPNGAFSCLSDVREKKTKIPQNLDFAGFVFDWLRVVFEPLAERRAPEPTLSENIIKLQIADNHILSTMKSKSKSF